MTFRVSVDDAEARRQVRAISAGLQDLRGFWPLVVPLFTSWMRLQFETSGSFGGRRWQPLSPSTVADKARRGLRPEILQATGRLKQDASRPARTQTPTSLTLTIQTPYLQYHQTGDGVPSRPLVFGDPLPPVARAELDRAADTYVRGLLGAALGRR